MVFDPCIWKACVNVSIVDDSRIENTEVVPIGLEIPADVDQRIQMTGPAGSLEILDDPNDGKYYIIQY